MKTIWKFLANKVASILVLILVVFLGYSVVRNQFFGLFAGTHTAQHKFVIKRFSEENKLVVAEAEVVTTVSQTFENNELKSWPDWTQPITRFFVGREMTVDIPVQTEFKLVLKDVEQSDIDIRDNQLNFKVPLKVEVDSQQYGKISISNNSNGLLDKAVDVFTSGQKAQEFLNDKSQEAVYKISEDVLKDQERQEKVAQYASQALESLLNLTSDEELRVNLTVDDLDFVIIDER